MNPGGAPQIRLASFRARLLIAMTLIVITITCVGLWVAQRKVAAEIEHDLQRDFEAALASLESVREVRLAALAERCRGLVRRPRIHAALEDNALDLLYPSARDELRDLTEPRGSGTEVPVLHARFYRFLDSTGAVIPPPKASDVGDLPDGADARLALPQLPQRQNLGYLPRGEDGPNAQIDELIAVPIVSSETGDTIAALVLGFLPSTPGRPMRGMNCGIWSGDTLHLPGMSDAARAAVRATVQAAVSQRREASERVTVNGVPHQVFTRLLNAGSLFPSAHEVCVYPLGELLVRQRELRWQAAGICAVLLLGGVASSHFLAGRFSAPVERLAVDSEEHRTQWARTAAELEVTSEELERAARFSADTSHQLKTPVTVIRAGLEELLASDQLGPEMREEVIGLVKQTFRLTHIIEDLLLLSRMDAGRLRIDFSPVNLNHLIEAWLDDLSAIPDGPDVEVEIDLPEALEIAGEKNYTSLIVQNLLINARKYNRPGGEIRIFGDEEQEWTILRIANTGPPIPASMQEHIFERFHRGLMAENIPGHGLGLNLARELMRLHHGELRLVRSDAEWTEFELRFRSAKHPPLVAAEVA